MNKKSTAPDFEDSLIPPYLRNPKEYAEYKLNERMSDLQGSKGKSDKKKRKWKIIDIDYNAWRRNSLDVRTIYSCREASILGRDDLAPSSRPLSPASDIIDRVDFQSRAERKYVGQFDRGRTLAVINNRRLSNQVLQRYNKPLRPNHNAISYGAPKSKGLEEDDDKITSFAQLIRAVRKKQTFIKVPKPTGNNVVLDCCCSRNNYVSTEFCDVLGPIACNHCIENANKKITRSVEENTFPNITCTASSLVAPTLAKRMVLKDTGIRAKGVMNSWLSQGKTILPRMAKKPGYKRYKERQWQKRAKEYFPKIGSETKQPNVNYEDLRPEQKKERVFSMWQLIRKYVFRKKETLL